MDAIARLEGELAAKADSLAALARQASALRQLIADLAGASTVAEMAERLATGGPALFGGQATLYLVDASGEHVELASGVDAGSASMPLDGPDLLATAVRAGAPGWDGAIIALPVRGSGPILGAIAVHRGESAALDEVQRDLYVSVAVQCGVAIERARAHDDARAVTERLVHQRERLALIARATELLTTSLDSRRAVTELARAVVPALADWCAIDERAADGGITQIALHHHDPAKLVFAARLNAEYPPPADETRGVRKVLNTGETEWVEEIPAALVAASARDPVHLALLEGLKLRSYAIVPIRARGKVLGALSLVTEGERRLSEDDVRLAEDLARRAGLALDNARLFEAVEASRAHLHALLMRVPAAIAILRGPDLRYELLNEEGAALIGRDDVIGMPIRDVFPQLVGTGFFERLERVYATGEPFEVSEAPVRAGVIPGDRYFNVVYQPLRDVTGQIDGLVTFSFEVTEQVRARRQIESLGAEVARSEARMRALVDSAAAVVWTATAAGEVVELSPSWLEYTGQTAAEYAAGGFANAIHPDDRDATLAIWAAAVARGGPYVAEHRLRRPDGSYAHTLARGRPLRDARGTVVEWVGCNVDVTELRRAEAAASEHAATQEALGDLSHAIVAENDIGTVVQIATDVARQLTRAQFGAFFYNVTDEQGARYTLYAISGVPREAFSQFPMPRATAVFEPTFLGKGVVRSDDITADPRYGKSAPHHGMPAGHLPVRSYLAVPVVTRDRDVIGGLFFGHADVGVFDARAETVVLRVAEKAALAMDNARLREEAARLIKSLEVSNRELDQFAYVASHDLKAPLRGIGSLAEWIEEDLGPALTDAARSKLELLRRRVQRMEGLIQGILEFSRVGRASGRREEVQVGKLLADVIDLAGAEPHVVTVDAGMPVVYTERVALQQVFLNLITNAIKHAERADVRVDVRAKDAGDQWEFRVADNGPGVAPEFQDRIWGIFQTLQARDKVESTGIGLAIVKKIVESRGGRTWIESVAGEGATFCFTWPKHDDRSK